MELKIFQASDDLSNPSFFLGKFHLIPFKVLTDVVVKFRPPTLHPLLVNLFSSFPKNLLQ